MILKAAKNGNFDVVHCLTDELVLNCPSGNKFVLVAVRGPFPFTLKVPRSTNDNNNSLLVAGLEGGHRLILEYLWRITFVTLGSSISKSYRTPTILMASHGLV